MNVLNVFKHTLFTNSILPNSKTHHLLKVSFSSYVLVPIVINIAVHIYKYLSSPRANVSYFFLNVFWVLTSLSPTPLLSYLLFLRIWRKSFRRCEQFTIFTINESLEKGCLDYERDQPVSPRVLSLVKKNLPPLIKNSDPP